MRRLLEICCDSLTSALTAEAAGADRIELCACLECDGLTPSAGLLASVLAQVSLPVFAMARPRPGDFIYSETEVEVILADIADAKARGAAGIVSGALLPGNKRIDAATTRALVEAARPLPLTFHRAFDLVAAPFQALQELADLGVARVLTSGGAPRALDALEALRSYQEDIAGRLTIVACGKIRAENLAVIADIESLTEFHSAARPAHGPDTVDQDEVATMARILVGK